MKKNGLTQPIVWLDSAESASYPGSGTTWYDLTGNGNNAVMAGSVTYLNNVMKLTGGYFDFGVNNNMKIGLPLSLTFVVNMPSATGYDLFRNDSYAYSGIASFRGPAGLEFSIMNGSGGTGSEDRYTMRLDTPPVSQWAVITALIKGTTDMELYVNNVQSTVSFSGNNYSGIGYGNGGGFIGKTVSDLQIRAFKMYPYALTAQQVEDDYNYYSHML